MNKCILFSLGLARAEPQMKKEKKNLKQMVKSNKRNRGRGADRETELENGGERESVCVCRNKNEKKNPSTLAAFSLLFFKKL